MIYRNPLSPANVLLIMPSLAKEQGASRPILKITDFDPKSILSSRKAPFTIFVRLRKRNGRKL